MMSSKKNALSVLVFILLGISIAYRVFHPFEQPRVDTLTYTGTPRVPGASDNAPPLENHPDTREQEIVQAFLRKPRIAGTAHKDLFSATRPPAPVQETTVPLIPAKESIDIIADNPIHNTLDPKEQVREDMASYRIYGTYDSDAGGAVFMTREDQVIVAKEGDRIDGKYLIEEIRKTHIRIRALHVNETIHLDMREFNNE